MPNGAGATGGGGGGGEGFGFEIAGGRLGKSFPGEFIAFPATNNAGSGNAVSSLECDEEFKAAQQSSKEDKKSKRHDTAIKAASQLIAENVIFTPVAKLGNRFSLPNAKDGHKYTPGTPPKPSKSKNPTLLVST
jgi:hypothetical protein